MTTQTQFPLPTFRPDLVALDMDGTLLNEHHQLSFRTVKALTGLAQQGIPFVIATGRHIDDVHPYLKPISVKPLSIIVDNGGSVWPLPMGPLKIFAELDSALSLEVIKCAEDHRCHAYVCFDDGRVRFGGQGDDGPAFIKKINIFQSAEASAADWLRGGRATPYKISLCGSVDGIQRARAAILSRLGAHAHHVTLASGLPQLLDVMPMGFSKARALEDMMTTHGFSQGRVVAVGDGMNDAEMIQWAGFSYAMGNAFAELKKLAHAVLPSHVEDGVAQLLERLVVQSYGVQR